MPVMDIVVLAAIVGVFLAFMVTLAWVSETEGRRQRQRPTPSPQSSRQPPVGARHA